MIQILIADAQLLSREGLKAILREEPNIEVICEVENCKQLEKCLKNHRVDVAILDYVAESKFDVNDVKFIKMISPKTEVLVISSDDDSSSIRSAIDFGSHGFLTKECDKDEILDAIKAIYNKEKFYCSKIINLVFQESLLNDAFNSCAPSKLSVREAEVLQLVSQGLTTAEISKKLHVSAHTVSTHRKNIARKLNIKSQVDLLKYALNSSN